MEESGRIFDRAEIFGGIVDALARAGWETVRPAGQGAFSRVYLVRELKTGRRLACKILKKKELARRESGMLFAADHPLFPEFVELREEGENAFLFMEYVCGDSLEQHLRRRGGFSGEQTARAGMALAEGLRFLHQLPEPILYRDLRPANVMIRQDGRIKLLDMGCACPLGLAHRTRAGTPGFAAPEQFEAGARPTFASDVYGLGRLLEKMAGHRAGRRLGRVIAACTETDPLKRVPDMQGVAAALAPLCGDAKKHETAPEVRGFRRSRAVCVKSVWESGYKNG